MRGFQINGLVAEAVTFSLKDGVNQQIQRDEFFPTKDGIWMGGFLPSQIVLTLN